MHRFPAKSATAGNVGDYTLFGAPVSVTIPVWTAQEDGSDDVVRETTVMTIGKCLLVSVICKAVSHFTCKHQARQRNPVCSQWGPLLLSSTL
jgi:hypothetical protein